MKNLFVLSILLLVLKIHTTSYIENSYNKLSIELKWYKSTKSDKKENFEKGMLWSLSYLGAKLPKGCKTKVFEWKDSSSFVLHINEAGFEESAYPIFDLIINRIKKSEEYKLKGGIDAGRFLLLTLYAPAHYYKITSDENRLQDFENKYELNVNPLQFPVDTSGVSKGQRLIHYKKQTDVSEMAFIAAEGTQSCVEKNFNPDFFDCWSVMKNGQLRYVIFNKKKQRVHYSSQATGKPAKCMWCHETDVQKLYSSPSSFPGRIQPSEFSAFIDSCQNFLDLYRKTLDSEINFSERQAHTLSELIYISFMEPSAFRLSQEWNFKEEEVKNRMKKNSTHIYEEFPFLGNLYYRKEADKKAPYKCLRVSDSVRDYSKYEPNYFR